MSQFKQLMNTINTIHFAEFSLNQLKIDFCESKNQLSHEISCSKNQILEDDFFYRSVKTCCDESENSFQKEYLFQHSQAFIIEFQKLMENLDKKNKENAKEYSMLNSPHPHPPTPYSLLFKIPDPPSKQDCQGQKAKLKKYEKVRDFLQFIANNVPEKTAAELVMLALRIVGTYDRAGVKFDQIEHFVELAEFHAEKDAKWLFHSEKLKRLNYKTDGNKNTQLNAFTSFLRFYYATVLLLVGKFFQNPYFEKQKSVCSSAQSSDNDESQPQLIPNKRFLR